MLRFTAKHIRGIIIITAHIKKRHKLTTNVNCYESFKNQKIIP